MAGRLDGKVAIVTGAGSAGPGWGNGKATAALFAREGARVFAVDRNPDAAAETSRIIEKEGGTCTPAAADVSKSDQVAELVSACRKTFDRIDILHNNVGISSHEKIEELEEEEWDRVFAVNVKSIFLTCREVLSTMIEQGGGSIINISSIASIRDTGLPQAAYNSSKGAVNQLTQSIAVHHASQGVRCNAILPGLLDTPMIYAGKMNTRFASTEEMVARRHKRPPTGKMGTAWDVAYASLFLGSDEARYINGAQIVIDGGLTATTR